MQTEFEHKHEIDYPRPQFVRNDWINLNGKWNFVFDDADKGEYLSFFNEFPTENTEITVPFTYETELSGIYDEKLHENVWYERTFNIGDIEKRTIVHFEGSDYITKIWVNGRFVGIHRGGYERFSFDITNYVVSGENKITVKVSDYIDCEQPRGKQRWGQDSYGCWYIQTTGIWKTVWIERVNNNIYIDSVKMTPDLKNMKIDCEVNFTGNFSSSRYFISSFVDFDSAPVNSVYMPITKKHMVFSIDVSNTEIAKFGVKEWSPANPNLYDIRFEISDNENIIDTVYSYFGMRSIEISGNQILLNGRPIYQKLILDQGYWKESHLTPPSEEAIIKDVDMIISMGYNGVRKHQKIEDERFLYWADVKGLFVWSEMAATYKFSDNAVSNFIEEWIDIVKQNYNHPSIITWTPFNESWGISAIKNNDMQKAFTESIYYLTKAFDSMRPVISNDGWEHTHSDIVTLHDYESSGKEFAKRYMELKNEILNNEYFGNEYRGAFADGYKYNGQPVIISEFGGIAIDNNSEGWGYGDKAKSEREFFNRFEQITDAIKSLPYVCGYCYTQLTDVQQEVNGLLTEERKCKVDINKIRNINDK